MKTVSTLEHVIELVGGPLDGETVDHAGSRVIVTLESAGVAAGNAMDEEKVHVRKGLYKLRAVRGELVLAWQGEV